MVEISPAGVLARVRRVVDDGLTVYLDLRSGETATIDHCSLDLQVGDVVLIYEDEIGNKQATLLQPDAWPDEPWVGVVRLKLDDVTLVDVNGRLRRIPTTKNLPYGEGNTVEGGDFTGVKRVLADEPVKMFDLPVVDESAVETFRVDTEDSRLTFDDFGGLDDIVKRARELVELPLQYHEQLSEIGARPIKGVLFTGEPGTGKTLLARIIAAEAGAAFYEISGPEIFSKWYGQSEELLRRLFDAAAAHAPSIVFFDEIDSVAGNRQDAHEASKRVVAQLLTRMDGFASDANVIVIATTNRPQDLDPALRRPGRFDWEINFPRPDRLGRYDILRKSSRGLRTSGPMPHLDVAKWTDGWSGADLAAVWSEAALLAVADRRAEIVADDYLGGVERVARQRARKDHAPLGIVS